MLKKIIKNLSPKTAEKLIRLSFNVPTLADDPDFTIKLAETKEELEAAYALLHDCYVSQKLMSPQPSGLRCTLYSLLPETATVIVKYKDETVGTVTLVKDSRMGLPSDEKYQKENDRLRARGARIIEVSSLAVSKKFRSTGHAVSLLLMKYLFHHSIHMGGTDLVITIHPRTEVFYSGLFQFKRSGEVVQYDYVNGALAVYLTMPLKCQKHASEVAAKFNSSNIRKNMALWTLNCMDDRFQFPKLWTGQVLNPVLTPDLMEYFFVRRTNLLKNLPMEKRRTFFEILIHFFGESEISRFREYYCELGLKEYRMGVHLTAGLEINNHFFIVDIFDLSTNGAFAESSYDPNFKVSKGDKIILRFKVGMKSFHVDSQVMWMREFKESKGPMGFGVKFSKTQIEIKEELQLFDNFKKQKEVA